MATNLQQAILNARIRAERLGHILAVFKWNQGIAWRARRKLGTNYEPPTSAHSVCRKCDMDVTVTAEGAEGLVFARSCPTQIVCQACGLGLPDPQAKRCPRCGFLRRGINTGGE